jgi:MinD-like ATPase involved in chromosome partitioning or flagellar assembly/Flp pilus assembly protein TadD
MKTITFYSYKGGVGRTLALANIAKRLAEFGKKVCILDFDLEAPGLHIKLENQISKQGVQSGIVDYIYDFSSTGEIPGDISKYATRLRSPKNMVFIAAGNPSSNEYWKKLAQINWWKLFYSDQSEGIPFFLDLKERIKEKYKPDYLLIDSRTGITELSAITISILADSVVFFSANNKENINGCKHVLRSISKDENNLFGIKKDIHFVLSRIPKPEKPDEKTKEEALLNKIFSEFGEFGQNENISVKSLSVLHSDRELEMEECVKIGYEFEKNVGTISKEYLEIFNKLTESDLTDEEKKKFNNIRECVQILERALNENDFNEAIKLLDKAALLDTKNADVYFHKGRLLFENEQYESAKEPISLLIEIEKPSFRGLYARAAANYKLNKLQESLNDLETAIEIDEEFDAINLLVRIKQQLRYPDKEIIANMNSLVENFPEEAVAYNTRSDYFRQKGDYEKALTDIYTALQLDTEFNVAYATLAEIKACQKEHQEFYRNFEMALKYKFDSNQILEEDILPIYLPFFKEDRFIKLLEKYNRFDTIERIMKLSLAEG